MDNRKHQVYTLNDGRKMGYAEYGLPGGFPVFIFHGTPGSRLWFQNDDPIAFEVGLRLIATDRPGYGLSDPLPGRAVLDYPNDILTLANHLGIDQFSVISISGGGAFAAACAYELPDCVASVAMVASVSEFQNRKPPEGMCNVNRTAFFLARYAPWLMRYSLNAGIKLMYNDPAGYVKSIQEQVGHLCSADREIVKRPETGQTVLMHLKEAFRQNVREAASEAALLTRAWGFNVRDIKVPVHLWQGTEDTLAPIEPVRAMAKQIPASKEHFLPGQGHFLDADPVVWRNILQSVNPSAPLWD